LAFVRFEIVKWVRHTGAERALTMPTKGCFEIEIYTATHCEKEG